MVSPPGRALVSCRRGHSGLRRHDVEGQTLHSRNLGRIAKTGILVTTALVLGTASAQAVTWATSASPLNAVHNGITHGQGYGRVDKIVDGNYKIVTQTTLRDPYNDGLGVYERTTIIPATSARCTGATSGTETTQSSTWKPMNAHVINLTNPSLCGAMNTYVKVCQNAGWRPDICSATRGAYRM